jgi:DNA-binding response OmpR family regulator
MLIVDDERVITFALKNYFVELGFTVDCAGESEEALALLSYKEYDVVIADLRLTGTTSEEGLDVIRLARERSSSTCIILLTALGADALLQKPKPLPELAQTVFALMESR